ncbi:MAG: hypothetical protein AAB131_10250, partial [Actinomycetota bacterium]
MAQRHDVLSFDTETDLIGPGNVVPNLVCLQLGWFEGEDIVTSLIARADPGFNEAVEAFLRDPRLKVGHFAAFDMAVLLKAFPQHAELIFQNYADGRVVCTKLREKLATLSTSGRVDEIVLPDGSRRRASLTMDELVLKHFAVDISADKKDPDSWRLRYVELRDISSSQWPEEALRYARDDGFWTLALWQAQEEAAPNEAGPRSMACQAFRAQVDFALYLQTAWGMAVDLQERDRIAEMLSGELAPEKLAPLIEAGILRPGESPRPHSRQVAKAREIVPFNDSSDITPEQRAVLEAAGIKFTAAVEPSIDTKLLQELVTSACGKVGIEPEQTPTGAISTDAEMLDALAGADTVLDCFIHRQGLMKLVTTELPALTGAVVHPNYDSLKETLRSNSYGNRKGRPALYPATNIQQKDPRARGCFVAREGQVLLS